MRSTFAAEACRRTFDSASWAVRRMTTSADPPSGTGVPATRTSARSPVSLLTAAPSRSRASPRVRDWRCPGVSSATMSRASSRLSDAVCSISASRSAAVAVSPRANAAWAARESATTEVKPCARVSWISREMRSRSSCTPRSRSAAASRAWVARSSSMVSARLSASPTIRLMNSPSERDSPIEMTLEMRISARLSAEKPSCPQRTTANAVTTSTVPTTAQRVGSIAHSWGKRAK